MPEPAFVDALEYKISGDKAAARRAIDRVSAAQYDLRQTALVFDWCQDELKPDDRRTLAARLRAGIEQPSRDLADARSQVLAAIALAGDDDAASAAALQRFLEREWRGRMIPALRAGHSAFSESDTYALYEILHAVRDNLNLDLREDFPKFFSELPLIDLLSYYPAPFPAAENEFHIPFSPAAGEPDLRVAALSRAAELAMVAFDTNAPESQVLQGWLMNDRFLMRGPFGSPYEFLWANPYQPGLSYYHVPLVIHDELLGRLFVRSSWEDDAHWAAYADGKLQEFRDGRVVPLNPREMSAPMDLDEAVIFFSPQGRKLQAGGKEANDLFVVGLSPRTAFHVEADDEEMHEARSDPGGILYFKGVRPKLGIRFNAAPAQP